MAVRIINPVRGYYEITNGVTVAKLKQLANDPKTQSIQFSSPLGNYEIDLLEEIVFSKREDIFLRIYGFYTDDCNLSFLERIPSLRKLSADCLREARNIEVVTQLKYIEHLGVGIFNLDNFDFLDDINPDVKEIYLNQTRSKKPVLDNLARFKHLECLYLEGHENGIEVISQLKTLERIILRSISTDNIDFIKGLQKLWSVDIKLGGIKNFEALKTLPQLKYLELWQIRGLSDLSFVSELTTLQYLFLQALRQVEKIPDLSKNLALRRIYLENMKGLKDFRALRSAPALKEFVYLVAAQQPEELLPVFENPHVEGLIIAYTSHKKNKLIDELASKFKKHSFNYNEFNYI